MATHDRTRLVCRLLYVWNVLALWLVPLLLVWVWFYADQIAATNQYVPQKAISFPLSAFTKAGMVLVTALVASPTYWGLFALRRFLRACCAEEYFTAQNSRNLKRFALGFLGSALLSPLSSGVMSVLLTIHNPPGQKMLVIGLSSTQVTMAAVGALLLVVASLLQRASLIAEEHAQII
ncbi:hypothetical protein Pan153_46480 [Gimesia panareensis]|uniref:DUF2975 domain-containing protein n=1 Tax=Gimesia panareensis TaxID=2527978 RepID=A0A518FUG8_9PLAN|nr:DUF2975 domain-containing protein [Gimesia panareensis]QDV19979.1 hypothetical protein Pan153_46480 [Gimesia panareensis]